MKSTKLAVVACTALGVSLAALAGVAGTATAATKPDPVQQAYIAATSIMKPATKITQTIPLKVKAPTGKLVVCMQQAPGITTEPCDALQLAATNIGWQFRSISYAGANNSSLQQGMLNALQLNPAGVVVGGADPSQWGAAVTAAFANAKVPIINGAVCPAVNQAPMFPGAGTCAGSLYAGARLADWIIADSRGKASVIWQTVSSLSTLTAYTDGFMAEFKRLCPACKVQILDTTLTQFASGQIPSLVVNQLRANPDIQYAFFANNAFATGFTPALSAAGLLGRIKVGGAGLNATTLASLKAHTSDVWIGFSGQTFGYANMDSLLRVLTLSSGITKNGLLPYQLATPDNADSIANPYTNPQNALAQYLHLWHW